MISLSLKEDNPMAKSVRQMRTYHLLPKIVPNLAAGIVLALSIIAVGQGNDKPAPDAQPAPGDDVHLEQRYHGVTPGSGNNLPKVEELRYKNGAWVTWPGFLMLEDGSSRLFLQTTGPLKIKTLEKKGELHIVLKKTKIYLSNNKNPLVTKFFNTPIETARLKKSGKNAVLIVTWKEKTPYKLSQTTDEDGYHYIFIDFPQGEYPNP